MISVFVLQNLIIFLGYCFSAVVIVPLMPVREITKWAGRGFFITCGLTHLESLLHVSFNSTETPVQMAESWHMLLIHGFQSVFILVFCSLFIHDLHILREQLRHYTESLVKQARKNLGVKDD